MIRTGPNTWEAELSAAERIEVALHDAWGKALGYAFEQIGETMLWWRCWLRLWGRS